MFLKAVHQFLFRHRLLQVFESVFQRDRFAVSQADIFGREVLGKDHAAGTVGDGMEEFHRQAIPVI